MKKKLNIDAITNELEGASLFFARPSAAPTPPPENTEDEPKTSEVKVESETVTPVYEKPKVRKITKRKESKIEQKESNRDTTIPRHHDTTVSRYHDTIIELVRKAVRELGKEAATHRFTMAEKKAIADIIYTYKNESIRTSENEIARIAVNFIIEDYRENGKNSVLDKALKALNE
jgi:hypothetical protein